MWMPQSGRAFPRWPRETYAGSSFDENLDRFIPNRSAMDFDFAKSVLTQRRMKAKENTDVVSPTRQAYRKKLAEACDMNRRIFAFKNKTPIRMNRFPQDLLSSPPMPKPLRHIPRKPEKTFDAPEMVDDFNLNLLDWASSNVLAIGLGNTAYLWDASKDSAVELVTVDEEDGPITSINWAPDSRQIAIGLDNSHVQLWDSIATRKIRTFQRGHRERVGSLAWNNHILTSGGMDGKILNRDVRMRSPIVETYKGHREEVCGLKWSESHRQLASGGDDNLLYIWDRSLASSSGGRRKWLHKLVEHTAAVRALAWCPFESSLLASGGGAGDQCIKFWNTQSGHCLNSTDTGSEVCSLLWNMNERELLSSHGFSRHQLTLWRYPSMEKMAELSGHSSRVLHMAQGPDGCTVASAAGDERLKFWNVFGTPGATKPKAKAYQEPFPHVSRIR